MNLPTDDALLMALVAKGPTKEADLPKVQRAEGLELQTSRVHLENRRLLKCIDCTRKYSIVCLIGPSPSGIAEAKSVRPVARRAPGG